MKTDSLVLKIILGIFVVSTIFIHDSWNQLVIKSHACRFWGIVFSEPTPSLEMTIRTHLDSLKSLGDENPDGWGIGYYVSPEAGVTLPVISKGEPSAPFDPRYEKTVEELIKYVKKSSIAHVRKTTTGLMTGIPDPHPFCRKTINRDFNMLFAHNGHLSISVLLNLVMATDPSYADSNPPDYAPNFIDSDLLFIYLLEFIDTYPILPVETCIKMAVAKLDSASGEEPIVVNFVMTNDSALWALRFAQSAADFYPVHYYPNGFMSDFWVAASVPLDTFTSLWVAVPNSTLVTLIPNQPPKFTSIYGPIDLTVSDDFWLSPNPFYGNTKFMYQLSANSWVHIRIYDIAGRLVKNLVDGQKSAGYYTTMWDGTDNRGNNLAHGTYFCTFESNKAKFSRKVILLR